MGLQIHERRDSVVQARISISQAVIEAVKEHDLTFAELASILAGEISGWAKYAVREERHGNTEKPGDIA